MCKYKFIQICSNYFDICKLLRQSANLYKCTAAKCSYIVQTLILWFFGLIHL